jgi:very-short-patch-repair endonuclease
VIEQAVRMQIFDLRAVDGVLEGRPAARGRNTLIKLLADYREPPWTRSELEREFLDLVAKAGLPPPKVNARVAGLEVDFFWPQFGLVVEIDGRSYHSNPRAFETDRIRDARLLRHGYRVLRITAKRLRHAPRQVIGDILALAKLAAA